MIEMINSKIENNGVVNQMSMGNKIRFMFLEIMI